MTSETKILAAPFVLFAAVIAYIFSCIPAALAFDATVQECETFTNRYDRGACYYQASKR